MKIMNKLLHGFNRFGPTSSNPQEAYNIYQRGYGSAWYNALFNKYKLKVSLLKDNIEKSSIHI